MEVEQTGGWYLLTYVKERVNGVIVALKLEFELMKLKTILPVVAVAGVLMCEPAVLLHAGTSDFASSEAMGWFRKKKKTWNCNICFDNGLGKSKMKRKA